MEQSGRSIYEMTSTFETVFKRMHERFPEINVEETKKFSFFLAMNIHRQQVEPLLKIIRVVDECLDIIGAPKVSAKDNQELVDLVTLRMALTLEKSELNIGEMQGLHRLLTVFRVPATDVNGHAILLTDRFRGLADALRITHDTTDLLAQSIIDDLRRNSKTEIAITTAAMTMPETRQITATASLVENTRRIQIPETALLPTEIFSVQDTRELERVVLQSTLHIPTETKRIIEDTVSQFLPPTKSLPLVDQLAPELAAIREELIAAHAENSRLSEQITLLSKTVKEKTGADREYSRRLEVALEDLAAHVKATEKQLERALHEHREESAALRQEMAAVIATADRLSAALATNNKDTARQLIEEALDTASAREAMKAMVTQEAKKSAAEQTDKLVTTTATASKLHSSPPRYGSGITPKCPAPCNGSCRDVEPLPIGRDSDKPRYRELPVEKLPPATTGKVTSDDKAPVWFHEALKPHIEAISGSKTPASEKSRSNSERIEEILRVLDTDKALHQNQKSRQEIRAAQLRQTRPQSPKPAAGGTTPPRRPRKHRGLGTGAILLTVLLVPFMFFVAYLFSTKSYVSRELNPSQDAKFVQSLQEAYLKAAETVRRKFPNIDLASTTTAFVVNENEVMYEKRAISAFEAWLKVPKKTSAMQASTDSLAKAGGFRYSKTKGLDPAYGLQKDGAKAEAWQIFLTLRFIDAHERAISPDGTEWAELWSQVNWYEGYYLFEDDRPKEFAFDWSIQRDVTALLANPPGSPKDCLLPPAVASLKGKVPDAVIKARACPVQHLTPTLYASFGKHSDGEKATVTMREFALKNPKEFWNEYCVVPKAIDRVHDETNIPVAELRAKACKS